MQTAACAGMAPPVLVSMAAGPCPARDGAAARELVLSKGQSGHWAAGALLPAGGNVPQRAEAKGGMWNIPVIVKLNQWQVKLQKKNELFIKVGVILTLVLSQFVKQDVVGCKKN